MHPLMNTSLPGSRRLWHSDRECETGVACLTGGSLGSRNGSHALFEPFELTLLSWSPVTESNRRPSPYHVDSGSRLYCCDAGQRQFRCRRVAGACLRFPLRSGTRLARSNLLIRRNLRADRPTVIGLLTSQNDCQWCAPVVGVDRHCTARIRPVKPSRGLCLGDDLPSIAP
jgi:hypothetical protein